MNPTLQIQIALTFIITAGFKKKVKEHVLEQSEFVLTNLDETSGAAAIIMIIIIAIVCPAKCKTNNLQTNKKTNNNSSTASVMSDLVGQCPQPLSLNE